MSKKGKRQLRGKRDSYAVRTIESNGPFNMCVLILMLCYWGMLVPTQCRRIFASCADETEASNGMRTNTMGEGMPTPRPRALVRLRALFKPTHEISRHSARLNALSSPTHALTPHFLYSSSNPICCAMRIRAKIWEKRKRTGTRSHFIKIHQS